VSSAAAKAPAASRVAQDYLKVIWGVVEEDGAKLTSRELAQRLGVGPSTVSETLRRLSDQGLLVHARYGGVELTDAGRELAVAMVRRHRLLETFLSRTLRYGWDEVHDEAETLEHAVTDAFVRKVDELLGHPSRDPHGDPIPDADGRLRASPTRRLDTLQVGDRAVVNRISDRDPTLLRLLGDAALGPDATVRVLDRSDAAGTLTVTVDGGDAKPVTLAFSSAAAVLVDA
jgi:DtxR family transcriptional regulator, Mn-dependent transcriptional regulator